MFFCDVGVGCVSAVLAKDDQPEAILMPVVCSCSPPRPWGRLTCPFRPRTLDRPLHFGGFIVPGGIVGLDDLVMGAGLLSLIRP